MLVPYIAHVQCTDPGVISCMCEYHTAAYSVFWLKEKQSASLNIVFSKKHNTLEYGTIHHVIHETVLMSYDYMTSSYLSLCDVTKLIFRIFAQYLCSYQFFFRSAVKKLTKSKPPKHRILENLIFKIFVCSANYGKTTIDKLHLTKSSLLFDGIVRGVL